MPNSTSVVKRLFWDIEVSHNVVLAFRAGYDQTINHESIIKERKIVCIAYKWEGEKSVTVLRWTRDQDDGPMLRKFLPIANEADELVAYHGDRYDGPFFRTRCLVHNLEPIPAWKTVDPCAWVKKYFLFNSGKLDYVSKFLGLGGKMETNYKLWHDVLIKNCPVALTRMCRYCGVDVNKLEGVYHRLKFFVKPKTHAGVAAGHEKWSCPHCGSKNIRLNKKRITANGTLQFTLQCADCGHYYTVSQSVYNDYLKETTKAKKR